MMSDTKQLPDTQRRDFLRDSLVAATGVAATVVAAKSRASVTATEVTVEADKPDGYRLTKHIADYYKSAAI
jgi:hypothetical protein